jgi:hypothetical protein
MSARVSNSASVTLTRDELVKIQGLQRIAWGDYSKAYKKLTAAIERIDQRNEAVEGDAA